MLKHLTYKGVYEARGLIIASPAAHFLISAHCPEAYRIRSFENKRSPKTQAKLRAVLLMREYLFESVFDAQHGKRYLLFVYPRRATPQGTAAGRQECWHFLCGTM